MRKNIKQFISDCSDNFYLSGTIYEFGSLQVKGQEGFADLRPFFKGYDYIGCDYREGLGVDKVINIHNTGLEDGSVGTVICCDTLEHVLNPITAINEMKRILDKKGVLIITSVMKFPIHDYPHDYWRFTPECFKELLSGFDYVNVQWSGDKSNPHTVVGVASNVAYDIPRLRQDGLYARVRDYVLPQFAKDLINYIKQI